MNGLVFKEHAPVTPRNPNRVDIACFVGFIGRRYETQVKAQGSTQRPTQIPEQIHCWLTDRGYLPTDHQGRAVEEPSLLLDVPVPIESWDIFDHLFDWIKRPISSEEGASSQGPFISSYLGTAVRSFFAQGGRKCYVVRVGDPWPLIASRKERQIYMEILIPGYPQSVDSSSINQDSWRGVGHILGLPDVSFLCVPDLVDGLAMDRRPVDLRNTPPSFPEKFALCSERVLSTVQRDIEVSKLAAPRLDQNGYQDWVNAINLIAQLIARHDLEVQFVAALPIPQLGGRGELGLQRLLDQLNTSERQFLGRRVTTFVQLVYPWVRTPNSDRLPEQIESPDAILTGILARNVLVRGAFRSATGLLLTEVYDTVPALRRDQRLRSPINPPLNLIDQVSLLGPTPTGFATLSDVTLDQRPTHRPASINRLIGIIVRAARIQGQDYVFEPNEERLWRKVRNRLTTLLTNLWVAGGLRGQFPEEAFQVRCDRTTMSQNDIDNGRVIAHIQFSPAYPIEQITIFLNLTESSQVEITPSTPVLQEMA